MSLDQRPDRRCFFKVGAGAGGALVVAWLLAPDNALCADGAAKGAGSAKPDERYQPQFFVTIHPDNTVIVAANRLEFGQGVTTAFAMLVAEELDFPLDRIQTRLGGNLEAYKDPVMGMHLTGGSSSVRNSYIQYRRLGAMTRALLVAAAAKRWGVPVERVSTAQGYVVSAGQRSSYGELASEASALPLPFADPEAVPLKTSSSFSLIGKPTRRLDNSSVVLGQKVYGCDVKRPGQLTALLVRAPTCGVGQVKTFDGTKASQLKGVRGVFKVDWGPRSSGVAIVADGFWAAKQARDLLRVTFAMDPEAERNLNTPELLSTFRKLAQKPSLVALEGSAGFTRSGVDGAPQKLLLEYEFPYLAHAAMEPLNATVDLRDDGCDIWTATQIPGIDASAAASFLGIPAGSVVLHCLPAGGGFGRRAVMAPDYIVMACAVAKGWRDLGGKGPVQVMWTREDDMTGGQYRPMHLHRAELGFDAKGALLAWDHVVVGQSIMAGLSGGAPSTPPKSVDGTMVKGLVENIYGLPLRVRAEHPSLPIPVLWWRSVEHSHTAYVVETVIDECARRVGQDPVAFRLSRFGPQHKRHRAALELAAKKARYGSKVLIPGRAWGVAVHESFGSVVAYVVEVSLEDAKGEGAKGEDASAEGASSPPSKKIVVHRVTAGVHCNLVVNPLTAEAQIEGGMIYGLTGFLPGSEVTFDKGQPQQNQFSSFRVPRFSDVPPKVDVHFVPSDEAPTGLGEPGLPPFLPAVANALAKLTGRIPTQLPLRDFI
jgi:isoquinoline 1-oxidoreductase beta subunit